MIHTAASLLWLALVVAVPAAVEAFAPPFRDANPDFWDTYHHGRRLLAANATHSFRPRFIPPEHCLYLTEEDCKDADFRRGLQDLNATGNPSLGTFRVLVLLVRFPEDQDKASILPDQTYFETLFNGDGISDVNPIGSIKEWMFYNSLGQYDVTYDVQDWAATNKPASSFTTGTDPVTGAPVQSGRWSNNVPLQGVFTPVLQDMEAAGFDFSPYDANGDGKFDHLHIIHSGYPAELGAFDCTPPIEQMIWSQGSPSSMPGTYVTGSGIAVAGYTISSAWTMDVCSNTPTNMAVASHEYIHGFDVKDVYDTDYDEPTQGIGGLGAFDTMAFAYGWTADGTHPTMLSPFSKLECNWLTPLVISEDGLYAIQPAELSGQIYVITDPYPEGEYLIIEMRYGLKWDSDFTGRGIVIYHVDNKAGDNNLIQDTRGYPGHSNWPADHYRVAVIQKDGLYQIEKMENRGDETDFFVEGDSLGPGPDFPNTDSYQGGVQKATGVTITVTSPVSYIMQFKVEGLNARRLAQNSGNEALALQGYIPYGNATLATEEQMKEFRSPRSTEDDLYRMYQNDGPGVPFDYQNDYTYHMRGSANMANGASASGASASAVFTLAATSSLLSLAALII